MKKLIATLMESFREFSVADIGVFKVLLICIGMLLGAYLQEFVLSIQPYIWSIAVAALIYIVYKLFFSNNEE